MNKGVGLGKPNLIFVGKIIHQCLNNGIQFQNQKYYGSGTIESESLESNNLRTINTNNINTNISNLILSNQDEMDRNYTYEQLFKKNIEYEVLISDKQNQDLVMSITNIVIDTLNSNKSSLYINSESVSSEVVKSQLLKLNPGHIYYVINCLKENKKEIKKPNAYLLTALYNAVITMPIDTTLQVSKIMNIN